ncbi:HCP-like protein [Cylindrobasidium torrendii FP15055 ss-10]|uniref:HCP-like protein n=1 Tax=Cylindrobasidium torrendii FP15055 ss-10 TaxID=1314674 RepID=A0A0D7BER4_9AGAR|nr:HCP-like protein [Cylindrobasidium torrendii FP15055 ss-10]
MKTPTWLAVLALFLAFVSATTTNDHTRTAASASHTSGQKRSSTEDAATEATRAYKQAMHTLTALSSIPSPYQPLSVPSNAQTTSMLSSLGSSLGPTGSIIRIVDRLQQRVLRVLLGTGPSRAARRAEEDSRYKSVKVLDLLQHSTELGNLDALYTLGHVSLFPPTSHFPSKPKLAYDCFLQHAELTGNATSQSYLAFFYSTGYREVVPVDQARAQLYYTFAANGGDKGAQMALGYRYWSGIGTLEDCERASDWYEHAAEQSMAKYRSGPVGGLTLPLTPTRLSDLDGGIYGPGASVASTGLQSHRAAIKASASRQSGETWEDVLDYYMFNADRGETDFAYRLGKLFYQGSIYASPGGIASGSEGVGEIPRDYVRAREYFQSIARQVWPRDPANPLHHRTSAPRQHASDNVPLGHASASAGYLGRMYMRGEGVTKDMAMARMWFERGVELNDRECHNGLGLLIRDGLAGLKSNKDSALKHFAVAAGQELAEAQVNIAKYHYTAGEEALAATYFETAVRLGSPFEAYFYLGRIHSNNLRRSSTQSSAASSSCAMSVSFYKLVAERGSWENDLLREAEAAWAAGSDRGMEIAMFKWWLAAERGSEIAQNNLAYILDQDKSVLRLTRFQPFTPSNDTAQLALTQWTRAAAQKNIDALVKVGDYYYHNLGVAELSDKQRYEKAASYYQSAADTQLSALAMWNLGWMYENGIGVPQDFHLAKRHYDSALDTNHEAYLPVFLSMAKLYARSIWHTMMGGQDGLNFWTDDEALPMEEPERPRLEEAATTAKKEEPTFHPDPDDGAWYIGKARDEFRKRNGMDVPAHNEDPVQWAHRRQAQDAADDDYLGENGFRANGGDDDEFLETAVLMTLCLAIGVLIYLRTRMVDRLRREEREGRQRQPNGNGNPVNGNGAFPPDARGDWAVVR